MFTLIFMGVISLGCWAMVFACLRGCDWILISGYTLLPKEDKEKFKQQYDIVLMNKYIGKTMFLPISVVCTISMARMLLNFEWMISSWFNAVFIVIIVAMLVLCFCAAPKILGDRFKR